MSEVSLEGESKTSIYKEGGSSTEGHSKKDIAIMAYGDCQLLHSFQLPGSYLLAGQTNAVIKNDGV